MYFTVYKTTNLINGKIYIGIHKTKDPNDNYLGSGKVLQQAIEKYGINNFSKDIIAICDTEEEMLSVEKSLVTKEFLLFFSTYNLRIGGEGGFDYINGSNIPKFKGKKHSEETKRKIGIKSIGRVNGMKGKNPWNKGKKNIYSEEHLQKLRLPKSEEHKKKISETCRRKRDNAGLT